MHVKGQFCGNGPQHDMREVDPMIEMELRQEILHTAL
jgi:hypothetical protein